MNSIGLSLTAYLQTMQQVSRGKLLPSQWAKVRFGSGLKSCSGWTCYLLKQWLKTDWTWRTHGYLYPEPHRVSRLSLANYFTSWNVITFSSNPDFPESPVIPLAFFTVIRNVFRCCSFYPFKSWISFTILYGLL